MGLFNKVPTPVLKIFATAAAVSPLPLGIAIGTLIGRKISGKLPAQGNKGDTATKEIFRNIGYVLAGYVGAAAYLIAATANGTIKQSPAKRLFVTGCMTTALTASITALSSYIFKPVA